MSVADASLNLANACDALSDWISAMRHRPDWQEDADQASSLDKVEASLSDNADSLRTAGVSALLEGSTAALNEINNAAGQIKALNQQIAAFNQIVGLVASVVSLAGNAASGNLGGIVTDAASIVSQIQKL